MVPPSQALARAFALAEAADDEYERRTAAHALYYAFFHYAGESLESRTVGLERPFYWNGLRPNGHPVYKTHKLLQEGWVRYRDDYADANDADNVLRYFQIARERRALADYHYDADFTSVELDQLVDAIQKLVLIIDDA